MDYKVVIILLALLFLIILVYREVTTIKDNLYKNSEMISSQHIQGSKHVMKQLQDNMDKYVNQIKGISSDNLQQLRKITLLNHQSVIRPSNHFTETDNSEFKTNLNYLSDNKLHKNEDANNKIFVKEEPRDDFYMSEDEPKRQRKSDEISECAEKSSKYKVVCDGDKCQLKPITNNEEAVCTDIPIYVSKQINKIDDSVSEDSNHTDAEESEDTETTHDPDNIPVIKLDDNLNKSKNSLENSIIEDDGYNSEEKILIPVNPIIYKNSSKHKNEIEIEMINVITGNKLLNPMTSNEIMDIIKTGNDIQLNHIYINNGDSNTDTDYGESHQQKDDVVHSDDTFNVNHNAQNIDLSDSVKKLLEEKKTSFDEQIKMAREKKQETESVNESVKEKSEVKKKSVKAKKDPKLVSNRKGITLKQINEYNINDLRAIAQKIGAPRTYRVKNRSIPYRKEELYNNIEALLKNRN